MVFELPSTGYPVVIPAVYMWMKTLVDNGHNERRPAVIKRHPISDVWNWEFVWPRVPDKQTRIIIAQDQFDAMQSFSPIALLLYQLEVVCTVRLCYRQASQ